VPLNPVMKRSGILWHVSRHSNDKIYAFSRTSGRTGSRERSLIIAETENAQIHRSPTLAAFGSRTPCSASLSLHVVRVLDPTDFVAIIIWDIEVVQRLIVLEASSRRFVFLEVSWCCLKVGHNS